MFQRKEQSQADALQREANKAMKAQQQLRRAVESCRRCTESKVFHRNCVIATGENTYLRLKMDPDVLVEGHLEIVPISHVSSILQSDEETQVEIERFQSCLRRMYETQGKSVLFLETAVHFHSRPHAHIEVVPVEQGMEAEASMFFKEVNFRCCCSVVRLRLSHFKIFRWRMLQSRLTRISPLLLPTQAFFSCDEEWAQHRKIIELSSAKPLKRAVPGHFQYLSAEWGDPAASGAKDKNSSKDKTKSPAAAPYGGIVHPVESEGTIDTNFCLDVVAGLLDLEPLRMRRAAGGGGGGRGRPQEGAAGTISGVRVEKAVVDFKKAWDRFDWTQYM